MRNKLFKGIAYVLLLLTLVSGNINLKEVKAITSEPVFSVSVMINDSDGSPTYAGHMLHINYVITLISGDMTNYKLSVGQFKRDMPLNLVSSSYDFLPQNITASYNWTQLTTGQLLVANQSVMYAGSIRLENQDFQYNSYSHDLNPYDASFALKVNEPDENEYILPASNQIQLSPTMKASVGIQPNSISFLAGSPVTYQFNLKNEGNIPVDNIDFQAPGLPALTSSGATFRYSAASATGTFTLDSDGKANLPNLNLGTNATMMVYAPPIAAPQAVTTFTQGVNIVMKQFVSTNIYSTDASNSAANYVYTTTAPPTTATPTTADTTAPTSAATSSVVQTTITTTEAATQPTSETTTVAASSIAITIPTNTTQQTSRATSVTATTATTTNTDNSAVVTSEAITPPTSETTVAQAQVAPPVAPLATPPVPPANIEKFLLTNSAGRVLYYAPVEGSLDEFYLFDEDGTPLGFVVVPDGKTLEEMNLEEAILPFAKANPPTGSNIINRNIAIVNGLLLAGAILFVTTRKLKSIKTK